MAFVAGASRGIGAAIARALADAGAAVAVAARSVEAGRLPGTVGSVAVDINARGGTAVPVRCDVRNEESVADAIATTVDELGGLDIVVANAGILWLAPTLDTPLDRWERTLATNLTGTFLVTKAAIPHLVERGGGSLIAITSTGVGMTELGSNAYWVSKAAVERYYVGLAAELENDNIAATCLAPSGVVRTEGWDAAGAGLAVPDEMLEAPERVAAAAVLLAARRPRAGDATGLVLTTDDLIS